MRIPAKLAFSWKYRSNGILGAKGLSENGWPSASDMIQVYKRGRISVEDRVGGGERGLKDREGASGLYSEKGVRVIKAQGKSIER